MYTAPASSLQHSKHTIANVAQIPRDRRRYRVSSIITAGLLVRMGLQATTPQRYISPVEALKQNHIPGWTMEVRVTMHTIRPMPSYATRSSHPPEGGE